MSVLVTSLDKCGGVVRDARVAEGADPAVSGLRHLEPQIVGTRRRAATSRGHEAAESAHLVPRTPTLSSTASVGGPREGQCRSTASLSPPRCPPRHLLPAWAKTSPLVREVRRPRPRSLPVLEVALLIIGASNLRCCVRMAGQRRASRATWRHRHCLSTDPFSDHDVPAAPPRPRKLSATSDECPIAALILTSFSRSSGRSAVVGSVTGPRYRLLRL